MKRILMLLAALALMLSIAQAEAAKHIRIDDILYEIQPDDSVTAVAYLGRQGEVIIPAEVEGHPVTAIAPEAFAHDSDITSIYVPDSVTAIGEEAFCNCSNLVSIRLPAGLTVLRRELFSSCDDLRFVELPTALTAIEDEVFYRCDSLASLILPEGVTSIGSKAFYYCPGLFNVSVPSSVTNIADNAFEQLKVGVKYLTITAEVGSTAWQFAVNEGLRVAPAGSPVAAADAQLITSDVYQYYLLEDGTAQIIWFTGKEHHYVIPAELDGIPITAIGSQAFAGSSLLHSVVLPEGVTHIHAAAFRSCYKLRDVTLPASVIFIGMQAFDILTYAPYHQENVTLTFHTIEGSYARVWADANKGP